jgi:hypothetical protein
VVTTSQSHFFATKTHYSNLTPGGVQMIAAGNSGVGDEEGSRNMETELSGIEDGRGEVDGGEVEEDEYRMSIESREHLLRNYILFAMLGAGANWLLPTILFQEIPWFQDRAPEGLCLATYLNTVNSFSLIGTLTYVYINHYHTPIPHTIMMPLILWISVFATFFAAFTHSVTVNGLSICLMITTFFGATVGSLSAVVFNPFMTQFENIYITAARSGASASFLLCALLGIAQSPGSNTRFSPTVFLIIFACLFLLPIYAYHRIIRDKIGLRQPLDSSSAPSTSAIELEEPQRLSGRVQDQKIANPIHSDPTETNEDVASSGTTPSLSSHHSSDHPHEHYRETDRMLHCIETQAFPWLSFTLPYALSIGFVNFNTWGILSAVTPFAMEHASTSSVSGSFLLALAYEIGCFTLVTGDASTALIHFPFKIIIPLFAIFSSILYAAALNAPALRSNASAGYLLVVVFCLGRFIESHIVTECFRIIATYVPLKYREDASRLLGLADQISTVLGVITSSVLVSQLSSEC